MLLRWRAFALLSLAPMILIASGVMGPGVMPERTGGDVLEVSWIIGPPPQVCVGEQLTMEVQYKKIGTSGADALAPQAPLAPLAPGLVPFQGSGAAAATFGPLTPPDWPIASPTGWGWSELKYTAGKVGDDSIVVRVRSVDGLEARTSRGFKVVDCVYHAGVEAHVTLKGGGQYQNLHVNVVWNAGGPFTVENGVVKDLGKGSGWLEETYTSTNPEVTCSPTTPIKAETPFKYVGTRDKAGLHLGFRFDTVGLPDEDIRCTMRGTLVSVPTSRDVDLNTLPIAKISLYADRTKTRRFDFPPSGRGTLTITKAEARGAR